MPKEYKNESASESEENSDYDESEENSDYDESESEYDSDYDESESESDFASTSDYHIKRKAEYENWDDSDSETEESESDEYINYKELYEELEKEYTTNKKTINRLNSTDISSENKQLMKINKKLEKESNDPLTQSALSSARWREPRQGSAGKELVKKNISLKKRRRTLKKQLDNLKQKLSTTKNEMYKERYQRLKENIVSLDSLSKEQKKNISLRTKYFDLKQEKDMMERLSEKQMLEENVLLEKINKMYIEKLNKEM